MNYITLYNTFTMFRRSICRLREGMPQIRRSFYKLREEMPSFETVWLGSVISGSVVGGTYGAYLTFREKESLGGVVINTIRGVGVGGVVGLATPFIIVPLGVAKIADTIRRQITK